MDLDYIHHNDPDSIWLPPQNLDRKSYLRFVNASLIRYFSVRTHLEDFPEELRELLKNNTETSPNISNPITNFEFENGTIMEYPGLFSLEDGFYCSVQVQAPTSIQHIKGYIGMEPAAGPMFDEYLREVRRLISNLNDFFSRWSKSGVSEYNLTLLNNTNGKTEGFRPTLHRSVDLKSWLDKMEVTSYFRVDFEPEAYDLNRKLASTKGLVL